MTTKSNLAKLGFLTIAFCMVRPTAHAQPIPKNLGRFSDWSKPVNLGCIVNSEFIEGNPAVSPNHLSL
jgi:hypothetical protein